VEGSTGTFGLNQSVYTAMSYNAGLAGTPVTLAYGTQGGLGAFDIAALQWIYGANTTTNTGDDTYVLPTINAVGTGWSCIWDAGGTDTISGTHATSSVTIDLRPATLAENDPHAGGFISSQVRIGGGFTIANNVTIENAYGVNHADRLYGNGAANLLRGNGGADILQGFIGNDMLQGGAGNDRLYGGANKDIFVFNTSLNATTNKDIIGDWNRTDDTIQLENAVFRKLTGTGVLNRAYFTIGAAAKDSNDYIGYDPLKGNIWYDYNGNAAGGQVVFANIGKNKLIAYNDFVVS
jgi:serralysin